MEKDTSRIKQEKKINKRTIIVLAFLILVAIIFYVVARGNYLEIKEVGEEFVDVYWKQGKQMTITILINFAFIFLFIYQANRNIRKGLKPFFDEEKREMPKLPNKSIALIGAAVVSILTSSIILEKANLCFNSASFEINDFIFNIDIGYFIFIEPFIKLIFTYMIGILAGLLIYKIIYFIIVFNVYFDGINRQTLKDSNIIKQACNSIMLIVILIAILTFVGAQNVGTQKFLTLKNNDTNYSLYGAGIKDVTIKLWGYRILAVIMIYSAYRAIKAFKQGKTKKIITSILLVPEYLIILFITIVGFQTIFVEGNELDKEKQYIAENIKSTKSAYGINIEEVNLEYSGTIISEEINQNSKTIENIPITNESIVLKDLNALQTNKGYYSYQNTVIGEYNIDGNEQTVYISPREIISSDNTRTYNNKTYEYTHGYGTIITSATKTNTSGTLQILQKSFENKNQAINIEEPRIYFGLLTNGTVVTNSKDKKEFDYPINETTNAENIYDGKAGLKLNFLDRLILAIKEKDIKLALSGNVTNESKILTNRNVIERAKTVMPYFVYDENPYMVITDEGRLVWVLDAYTMSNNYPYSQKTSIVVNNTKTEINYIRNSVKVIIDAYDGSMKFYITDRTDPIAMAYYNMYTEAFVNKDEEIPEDIQKHLIYPKYLYNIQAQMINRYHNVQPDVLYRNDDIWDIATHTTGSTTSKTGTKVEAYYTKLKPGDKEEQLGLVLPYTPYEKQNIISYLVGNYDGDSKGKLTLYKFPNDSNILGPMQLDTQLEQDETISNELESLNVSGAKLTKTMVIVPIENTLLYVEPIYQQYTNEVDATPVLKKVIVASGTKVAIGNDLKEALQNLVSKYAVDIEIENTDNIDDLVSAIIKANKNLENSSSNNDWEMIGKDMEKLQGLINKLEELVEEQEKDEINEIEENVIVNSTNTIDNIID